MTNKELPYWITLSHLQGVNFNTKNEWIAKMKDQRISITEFFSVYKRLKTDFNLSEKDLKTLEIGNNELISNAFIAEDLLNQGFKIIPIISDDYPSILKKNLSWKCPSVIYAKGDLSLFKQKSIAIVGSRKASGLSLDFTANIAKNAVNNKEVIVSGYAKGVDRWSLESSLKLNGQNIIVLPQGITTFSTGYKKLYREILSGKVLIISTFHSKARWSAGLAMARNQIIYALGNSIYVAESDNKGGTWTGVIDGLKKNRSIYIRYPDENENNANLTLIKKGAKAIDFNGNIVEVSKEILNSFASQKNIINAVVKFLKKNDKSDTLFGEHQGYTSKEIISNIKGLNNYINPSSLSRILKKVNSISHFKIKNQSIFKISK